ncbi:MAG: UDP-glucose--hexose-1-phosphate uridylyltransferase [Anaerolineae bacterium]|nr:UDP-glucose--hexose-1-phosphate uridylyltransferase [Thermoflexales bacterium]MDW8408184.1 UDP-glucose--hexose-1-phosphate uridylyltransferase [Anaerolineae bacterium]
MTRIDQDKPHRRYNPLTDEWILVSPQRAQRPWLGAVEKRPVERLPAYDPRCYLCPGNTRAVGITNPPYTGVFVFDNDFPALLTEDGAEHTQAGRSKSPEVASSLAAHLLRSAPESGVCRVICFSPRHDLTLAELDLPQIRAVVDAWGAQCEELGARDDITYVQLFENKGEIMGCSNPHPHGQLWATRTLPTEPAKEQRAQLAWLTGTPSSDASPASIVNLQSAPRDRAPLLLDYLAIERREGTRLIFENDHFTCLVPYWAVWPFETMILPRRHIRRIVELTSAERDALADALKRMTTRYDNLFEVSFPYTMGVHQAPYDGEAHDEWQMHLHFYPPLLRSATVRKFMVGYEMLAQPQRDLTAEQAAERLRALSETRFT